MLLLDLFDNFTAKPVTCTWVIDKFLDRPSKIRSPKTKLSSGAFRLHLNKKLHYAIDFVARDSIPEFYYRISVIDKEGQKWNPEGINDIVILLVL